MELRRHNTIKTLPYHNWRECSNDIRWVRFGFDDIIGDYHEKKNPNGNVRARKEDYRAFEALQEEYVLEFGMSEESLELHNLQKELLIASIEALTEPIYINDVYRIEHEIKQFYEDLKNTKQSSIDEQLIDVEIWLKREIDLRVVSVHKLNTILKRFEKYCKDQKAAIENHKRRG